MILLLLCFYPQEILFEEKVEMRKLRNAELLILVLPTGRFIILWGPPFSYSVNLHEGFAVLFLKLLSSVASVAYSNTTGMSCLKNTTLQLLD